MTSPMIEINGYAIEISSDIANQELKEIWLNIQNNEIVPFFLTWSWIDVWINTYNPKKLVVMARFENEIVAIGLFTLSSERRFPAINSIQLRLHQMGNSLMDQIWMEYNDFICKSEHKDRAVNACLKALQKSHLKWDEIIISMMSLSRGLELLRSVDNASINIYRPCYTTNLNSIRETGKEYLQTLTSNTRYQIRRSIRHYQSLHGELSLHAAKNEQEALDYFHQAGPNHIKRWNDSGYRNPLFINFHENLIRASFKDNNIDLIKVASGNTTIAIMYYHIIGKSVFFYLHGLLYEKDSKLKPGLVAHSLASQYYLDRGMDIYDYMGGYSQYKAQLSNQTEDLVTVVIQRPRSRFRFERIARDLKNRIIHILKRRAHNSL